MKETGGNFKIEGRSQRSNMDRMRKREGGKNRIMENRRQSKE